MNFVIIMADQQARRMVGAYGEPVFDTPNLDRLASEGIRFDRAYTTSPVCTPARGAIFTGLYPQTNGAWANDLAPRRHIPLMGEVFRRHGYRVAYTGKWHLDGTGYNGSGKADGGFESDWWYDRANLMAELPESTRKLYSQKTTAEDLRQAGFSEEDVYAHRVADRAVDFLEGIEDEDFVLVASFDEPHDPWMAPPEWWEKFTPDDVPERPNYCAPLNGKPELQQIDAREIAAIHENPSWRDLAAKRLKYFGCNSYLDREIGRVLEALDERGRDDTVVIYTADHGDQLGSHGLHDKGAWMYEETCNIAFIVRAPGGASGAASPALVSHLDIMPTMLDLAGLDLPEALDGRSLRPVLQEPGASVRETLMVSFNRFGVGGQARGGLWPIRCLTDGRHKLSINLHDRDELYDLEIDPYELTNQIDNADYVEVRNRLHDELLAEMKRSRDPMWNCLWRDRPWRPAPHYYVPRPGTSVPRPEGFPWQW